MNSAEDGFPYKIREVDARRDILQVPQLIETCFHKWLDPDGARFIHEMQTAADKVRAHPLLSRFLSQPYAMEGVVCEAEDGRIVGNVSLFSVYINDVYNNLVANVCVHPDFRHQGIARRMMDLTLELSRRKGASSVYLQVREETPGAIGMYRALGFCETHKRTSWVYPKGAPHEGVTGTRLTRARFRERSQFEGCFVHNYPDSILWNINFQPALFRSGWVFDLIRRLQLPGDELWRVSDEQDEALGWFAFQRSKAFSDVIWFIPAQNCEEEQLVIMLRLIAKRYSGRRPILINAASGEYENAMRTAGYFVHNRLRWMKKVL